MQCLVRFSLRCNDSFKDSGGLTACINRAVPALCSSYILLLEIVLKMAMS